MSGSSAIIMPRVRIAKNCIVGVGAVATKDVPASSVIAGVTAKPIMTIDGDRQKAINKGGNTRVLSPEGKKAY
jgi:acetyltransferase-like isoleucine patch superfamily enzyme